MPRTRFSTAFLSFFLLASPLLAFASAPRAQAAPAAAAGPAAKVNLFVGTGDDSNLFPGPSLPFGMVQLSPDTQAHGYGYHYRQGKIQGFSLTHMSGPGCPNEGDVFFAPSTGPVRAGLADFTSSYAHAQEQAAPGVYRVRLARWQIEAELTATLRTGIVRLTYPAGQAANFLVPISHTLNYTVAAQARIIGRDEIAGWVENRVFCGNRQTYRVYFDMRFSLPFASHGTWSSASNAGAIPTRAGAAAVSQSRHGEWVGAYVRWPASPAARIVTARIGISYVSLAGARNNLRAEAAGKSFRQLRLAAERAWNRALSVIEVSGGAPGRRRVFYTSLYHSLLMPSVFSDADGRYLGFDGRIHHAAAGHLVYANFSGWDIYRSQLPLLALIAPRRMRDLCRSIVLMARQGGWIGRWPQINRYTNVMAGSPLTVALATAWLDGIRGFDFNSAWQGMVADATQAPPPGHPYQGEAGIQYINRLHYVPFDRVRYGSVSQLQEDCLAYAALARLALARGRRREARLFYRRALYVRNLFDAKDRFFRPRLASGDWVRPFDPVRGRGFIEGSGWQYQWLDPEDMAWLIRAVGPARFNRRLQAFFNYPKPGWNGRFYNPYNEPDLEAPFEFDFSGLPWRSQAAVRRILRENYLLTPGGLPGNDDCGEMSSWAVFSMIGLYSVDPASRAYELTSPVFRRVVIHLQPPYSGRSFTVLASPAPAGRPYIRSVRLDGKNWQRDWIDFRALARGGQLSFTLAARPNRAWGAAPAEAPPSLSRLQLGP